MNNKTEQKASVGNADAKVISFCNQKGGTGKTTSCLAVAGFLAEQHNVLVVDMDPQAHASYGLGVTLTAEEPSIYDAILTECGDYEGVDIEQVVYETPYPSIHLIPSELDLSLAELVLYEAEDKLHVLQRLLEKLEIHYDYILVDLPPHLGMLMMNGIIVADHVIIPVEPSWYGMESLKNFNSYRQELERDTGIRLENLSLILTRYRKPGLLALFSDNQVKDILAYLKKTYPEKLFIVPECKAVLMAQKERKLLANSYSKSEAAIAYSQLAEYLQ